MQLVDRLVASQLLLLSGLVIFGGNGQEKWASSFTLYCVGQYIACDSYLEVTSKLGLYFFWYLWAMKGYLYNVTISGDRSCSGDLLYYVEHRLFPAWSEREGWSAAKLLRIPTPVEDGVSVALQFELASPSLLEGFELIKDPLVTRVLELYGERVGFFPTLMEIISR